MSEIRPGIHRESSTALESQRTDSEPETVTLQTAVSGVAAALSCNPAEHVTLESYMLPGQPIVRAQRSGDVLHRAGKLFNEYFSQYTAMLAVPAYDQSKYEQQQRIRHQQKLMRYILGSRIDHLQPRPLPTLIDRNPGAAEIMQRIVQDACIGVVNMVAKPYGVHADQVRSQLLAKYIDNGRGAPTPPYHDYSDIIIPPPPYKVPQSIPSWKHIFNLSRERGRLAEDLNYPTTEWLVVAYPENNPVSAYTKAVRHPILTQPEILVLVRRFRMGQIALLALSSEATVIDTSKKERLEYEAILGLRAKQILVAHHLRLAIVLGSDAVEGRLSDDAVQGANLGMLKSMEGYDPYYYIRMEGSVPDDESTLKVGSWIGQSVEYHAVREDRVGRRWWTFDSLRLSDVQLVCRYQEEWRKRGLVLDYKDACAYLGFTPRQGGALAKGIFRARPLSLDQLRDSLEMSGEVREAGFSDTLVTDHDRKQFWQRVQLALAPAEYETIVKLYTEGYEGIVSLAEALGTSHQAVSQKHRNALRKLRTALAATQFDVPTTPKTDALAELGPVTSKNTIRDTSFKGRMIEAGVNINPLADDQQIREWAEAILVDSSFNDEECRIIALSFGLSGKGSYRKAVEVERMLRGPSLNTIKWVRRKFMNELRSAASSGALTIPTGEG